MNSLISGDLLVVRVKHILVAVFSLFALKSAFGHTAGVHGSSAYGARGNSGVGAHDVTTESPITAIEAHYLCKLESGDERVAFLIPSWNQAARVWLTLTDTDIGLEVGVETFAFHSCPFCFQAQGKYRFSGSVNRFSFETEVLTEISSAQDLPPGSEPPSDEDLPPGSEPPDENPDESPPSQGGSFTGPALRITYRELALTSQRVLFESQGVCRALPKKQHN